jgi:hypothetical protein
VPKQLHEGNMVTEGGLELIYGRGQGSMSVAPRVEAFSDIVFYFLYPWGAVWITVEGRLRFHVVVCSKAGPL